MPDHIGGGREGEADGAHEQDSSDPFNLLTIAVQVNTWQERDGAEGGNVNDETDKELLKQVDNVMHTVLSGFNAVGHDEEVSGEVDSGSEGGGGGEDAAEAGEQCLQPLPQ